MDTITGHPGSERVDPSYSDARFAELLAEHPDIAEIGHDIDRAFDQAKRQEPAVIGTAAVLDASRGGDVLATPKTPEVSQETKIARWGFMIIELRELMRASEESRN